VHLDLRAAPLRRRRAGSGRQPVGGDLAALRRLLAVVMGLLGALLPATPPEPTVPPRPYSLLQLNLCLSGLAGCYAGTPVVDEAVTRITAVQPDVVTLAEVCRGDVERIAAATQRSFRFVTVVYDGAPLPCVRPDGRGVFGNAVLTASPITAARDAAFAAQSDLEERRWLCVDTADGVRACTAHLGVAASPVDAAANAAQCTELSAVLAEGGPDATTVFGGDLNRQDSCAPPGTWTLRDSDATQSPGIQHVYGSGRWLLQPGARVLPMTHTDHDGLLVHALLDTGR
jgi:endonuclease/exonuclease/phosphatase (EEP) superfamily protein YafD